MFKILIEESILARIVDWITDHNVSLCCELSAHGEMYRNKEQVDLMKLNN